MCGTFHRPADSSVHHPPNEPLDGLQSWGDGRVTCAVLIKIPLEVPNRDGSAEYLICARNPGHSLRVLYSVSNLVTLIVGSVSEPRTVTDLNANASQQSRRQQQQRVVVASHQDDGYNLRATQIIATATRTLAFGEQVAGEGFNQKFIPSHADC